MAAARARTTRMVGTSRGRGGTFVARPAAGLLVLCLARALSAQPCVGDWRGIGQVGIADLVLAVNILLGLVAPSECSALGPGPPGIAQLVTAVNNALCACRACPTRRPTRTITASPTP